MKSAFLNVEVTSLVFREVEVADWGSSRVSLSWIATLPSMISARAGERKLRLAAKMRRLLFRNLPLAAISRSSKQHFLILYSDRY